MTNRSTHGTPRRATRRGRFHRVSGRALLGIVLSVAALPALSLLGGATPAGAQSVVATVSVGNSPKGVAVDASTDTIYVANTAAGTVSVVDGATNSVIGTPITVGTGPRGIAVDASTDTIYVANAGSGTVSVINGATNSVAGAPIIVGAAPKSVAVDEATDMVYVANTGADTVSVISGATGSVVGSLTTTATNPSAVAVDPTTDTVYVTTSAKNKVWAFNGTTDALVDKVVVGLSPTALGVDPTTGMVYVANNGAASVSVVDGATHTVAATVGVGTSPRGIGVDATNDVIYVANASGNVSVINGTSNTVSDTVNTGKKPFAADVDEATGVAYVTNAGSASLWVIATPAAPSATVVLSADNNPATVGQDVTYTATITGSGATPTGSVDFSDGSTPIGTCQNVALAPVAASPGSVSATCDQTYSTVAGSPHSITASYSGDGVYATTGSNVLSETVTVSPNATVVLSADNNPATVGQDVTYTATITGSGATPTGSVDFSDGSTPVGTCQNVALAPVAASPGSVSATCDQTYSTVAGSPHSITASYSGDGVYAPTGSNVLSETVNAAGTSTQLSVPPSLTYGAEDATPLSVTVSLTGEGTPTGSVAVTSGTTNICSITLSGGTGSCSLTPEQLDAATYPLKAVYTPDTGDFTGSSTTATLTVNAAGTSTRLVLPSSLTYGAEDGTPLSATVSTLGGAEPTGSVAVKNGSTILCSIALSGGTGTCSLTAKQLDAATYPLTASYTPDSGDFTGSSATGSLTVNAAGTSTQLVVPSPLAYGDENATPLSVTVSTLDGAVPKGNVAITTGATALCSITLSGGTGTCTLGAQQLGAGSYPLTASFTPSNGDFGSSSATGTLVIGQVGTTLTVHKAKSISLTALQLSATLTTTGGTAVPHETVTFSFAGTELCTGVTDASGLASCTINPTLVIIILGGSYDGVFAGDQNYGPSSGSGKL